MWDFRFQNCVFSFEFLSTRAMHPRARAMLLENDRAARLGTATPNPKSISAANAARATRAENFSASSTTDCARADRFCAEIFYQNLRRANDTRALAVRTLFSNPPCARATPNPRLRKTQNT